MIYKYTIIIPHKDIPQLLMRCLSSIPKRDDLQIIVVDDASSKIDEVKKICNQSKRIELLLTNESKGAGYARNCGLEVAKGKWVLFADADDFFSSSFNDLLEKHYNDDAEIIYFSAYSVYSESLRPSPKLKNRNLSLLRYSSNHRKMDEFCRYFQTEPWGKMIKRDLIERNNVKFDETKLANDYFFSVVTGFFAKKIAFDNNVIYVYTEREGSLSYKYSGSEKTILTRLEVYLHVQKFLDEHSIPYVPFYRYSFSLYKKKNIYTNLVESFWKSNSISKSYVFYRYIKGKIYQYTLGVHL